MSQNENKSSKVGLQVLGFVGLLVLVGIDAMIPEFQVDKWVYVGMVGFMLGVRPETIPDIIESIMGRK